MQNGLLDPRNYEIPVIRMEAGSFQNVVIVFGYW
jgi:hypothetical protein